MKSRVLLSLLMILFTKAIFAAENPVILQSFYWYIPEEGTEHENEDSNLWNLIINKMAVQFKNDGFTDIWLPPVSKNFTTPNEKYGVGYGVYDRYDLGEFHQMGAVRTRYGTKDELLEAVNALHSNGLNVVADIVMNHIIGAYEPEEVNYSFSFENTEHGVDVKQDGIVDAYVYFDFNKPNDPAPRNGKYSDHVWTKEHFDGMESWSVTYLFDGKEVDKTHDLGDIEELPAAYSKLYKDTKSDIILGVDFDFQNIDVQNEMLSWTKWLIDEVGFDGFRVDAVRHIHVPFIERWAREIKDYMINQKGADKVLMFGEFWDGWAERLNAYLIGKPENNDLKYDENQDLSNYCGIDNSMDLFDVPLHFDFQKVAKENFTFPITRMSDLPDRGLLALNPNKAVTFVDNHDTVPTQELRSYIPLHTKIQAYTFILLHEFGTPTVFYRDMYRGNFVSDYENDNRDYLYNNLKQLLSLRKNNAYGKGEFFKNNNAPGILGYKRDGDTEHKGSGLIYLIREFDSWDNGISIPTDNRKWKLVMGSGNISHGKFYINDNSSFAVWAPVTE